ncbi:hypothetical protein CVO77_17565 [Sphingopyxis lindanitolerans]|uniref:Uncharacterized protein n=1 Tax=Sphingopyxis lindanitolerans TaxID=2054227 RepID=A0A2S8B311_9SPHN|nr:hypothetical protein CVO77_17565 [Sphingopyxis lindanitolerans]
MAAIARRGSAGSSRAADDDRGDDESSHDPSFPNQAGPNRPDPKQPDDAPGSNRNAQARPDPGVARPMKE